MQENAPRNNNASDRCRICGNSEENLTYTAREMMFGLREQFVYFQCRTCRCLQIRYIPADMQPYYPPNYYSMQQSMPSPGRFRSIWYLVKSRIHMRAKSSSKYPTTRYNRILSWMKNTGTGYHHSILDVGCGSGKLLHELRLLGFKNLTGADPFIERELHYENGIRIHKAELLQLADSFDLIMMHHTFEHVREPLSTMSAAADRLRQGGMLLLRIPLADCYAWRHYGVNWFALDAPRHFYLHTETSIGMLAEKAGFEIQDIIYDSGAHQLWGSEQYLRDIPHRSEHSFEENPKKSIFSAGEIKAYARKSRALNATREGDSACFYLRRN